MRPLDRGTAAGLLAAACLATAALAPAAQAEQRIAAPDGTGSSCSRPAPCQLREALVGAHPSDEVIAGPGTYSLNDAISVSPAIDRLDFHGDLSGPMPAILASVAGPAISIPGNLSRIRYLEIRNVAGDAEVNATECQAGSLVERVRLVVASTAQHSAALTASDSCEVRDSLLFASGPEAVGLVSTGEFKTGAARNVTAVAIGAKSSGIMAVNHETHSLDIVNTIASGEGQDLKTLKGLFGTGKIFATSSNFSTRDEGKPETIFDYGGNQAAAPVFVDPAAGDYREAPGSPTIDAGTLAGQNGLVDLGPFDLAGNHRVIDLAPDIGAYEFAAAAVRAAPPAARLLALSVGPKAFRQATAATIAFTLSAPGPVELRFERRTVGRRAGRKCVKQTKANRARKKCALNKPVNGVIAVAGAGGANVLPFFGQLDGKRLAPGGYRLVGSAGASSRVVTFRIVQ